MMASNSPMVNGDISRGPNYGQGAGDHPASHQCSLEETLQQMNVLIKENRDLKEALKQTNISMKERFEGLSAWKEKQKDERNFLEGKLEEAKERVSTLTKRNEELKRRLQALEGPGGGGGEGAAQGEAGLPNSEVEVLKAQIARLQAEKSDLVAMNSELQLKMGKGSPDDSFIEIRIAQEGEMNMTKDLPHSRKDSGSHAAKPDLAMSRQDSEELTVSQLLQSLRKETQRAERLELELQAARERIAELEPQTGRWAESETQTSLQLGERGPSKPATSQTEEEVQQGASAKEGKSDSEVESLKGQMTKLFKELQQAQTKLDDAEDMKKSLHDRCRDMEQNLAMLQAQLVEKQQVQAENERLKLQLDSMQSVSKMEQKRAEDEKKNLAQLKDAYTKLFEDYNELKEERKKKEPLMSREEVNELQLRLDAAEKALATKQQKIDEMKQEIFKKEQELDTISVFKAQAEVYSSDFYAERAAREKIHEEKERLAAQLEFIKKQNSQLQDELESLGRQSLNEMQNRHVSRGANPHGGAPPHTPQGARGADNREWEQQNIPEYSCPKCNEILPDLDSLQIHIMDCII
ncbi:optineurin isoform X1 [Megalops cyprinoides]|uniref:optineurin isoform X1 n=1 Tax=Megalops cyprinoides TaxID=118141 RepID=UPI00186513E8|nr:optineurin isoform X1 [Megalops cyprinoides]XP_036373764.1 optineurin isoform X1 [Megalops cyprinoides]